MSEISSRFRGITQYTVQGRSHRWNFVQYSLSRDEFELDSPELKGLLEGFVTTIEESYLSTEFEHLYLGFIIHHIGRRGTTISIWHWGDWGGTWELFSLGWYAYHPTTNFELLDKAEPIMCQYEIEIISREGRAFEIATRSNSDREKIRSDYLATPR